MEPRDQRRVIAFIPVRGGSKTIPGKNIAPIAGRPLVYWTVRACADCPAIDHVYVATDSAPIRAVVEGFKLPGVTVVDRDPATATDTATTESALIAFLQDQPCATVVLVQATSPLLTTADLADGLAAFKAAAADSMVSVVRSRRFRWNANGSDIEPGNYDPQHRPRRQEWPGELVENGAFYISSREQVLATGCRVSGRIIAQEMPEETLYELDEPNDWTIIEQLLQARIVRQFKAGAQRPRIIAVDVDGTLTDGGMYYTADGEIAKRFDTRDAFGMNLLRKQGWTAALVTAENTPIVLARARKLGIDHVHVGISDKVAFMADLLPKLGFDWEALAYVGDDLNDLEVLRRAGFSACPADADPKVRAVVQYVCARNGGHGAVREVCNLLHDRFESNPEPTTP